MEQKTPLYDRHVACGGKPVPFAGYLLPIHYPTGIIAEHMAVRTTAGLFDVSHMGELVFSGPDALKMVNHLFTNDYSNLAVGRIRYGVMCYDDGGCVDDLIVYRMRDDAFLVVVNAANRRKDVAWIESHLTGGVRFSDLSDYIAQLALQGPNAEKILSRLCDPALLPQKYYSFVKDIEVSGVRCLVSRTGYTGEEGFELYCAPADAPALWDALLAAGKQDGLIPCGLGARDTLRLEAAMPLYGHEMDETISPLETGLAFGVKMNKPDFIGKAGIAARGTNRERIGLRVEGRGILREHCPVFKDGEQIGVTTSGTHCPYLGYPAAMALVQSGKVTLGETVEAEVRGRRVEAAVVALPFYKRG